MSLDQQRNDNNKFAAGSVVRSFPRLHLAVVISTSLVVAAILTVAPSQNASAKRTTIELESPFIDASDFNADTTGSDDSGISSQEIVEDESLAATSDDSETEIAEPDGAELEPSDYQKEIVEVKSGDNLSIIFGRLNIDATVLQAVMDSGDAAQELKRIKPGQKLSFYFNQGKQLREVRYKLGVAESIRVYASNAESSAFSSLKVSLPLEKRVVFAEGKIEDSFFESGKKAGLSVGMILKFADIFAWDVDFALDLQEGDRFKLIYEEYYLNGKKVRKDGDILAAEFVNEDRPYSAIRYTDKSGGTTYYTSDGMSKRKAFIRTPVSFTHIASRFTTARFHPILHKMRAHKGVDYATASGTPIKATGDGKVSFAGWRAGYGNVVEIEHAQKYSTLYGHMKGFARGIRTGAPVHQGEVIGYVGMTGLATGPHLHYEFRIDGVHHDPLTVSLPKANPISNAEKKQFSALSQQIMMQLAAGKVDNTLALANPNSSNTSIK